MGSQKNIITINGKQYDIITGKVVNEVKMAQPISSQFQNNSKNNVQVVDGIKPNRNLNRIASRATLNPIKRHPLKTLTLAREYVKKPKILAEINKEINQYPKKIDLHNKINDQRLHRAQDIQMSQKVSKFGNTQIARITKTVENISVKPEPKQGNQNYDISDVPPTLPVNNQFQKNARSADLFDTALLSADSHKQVYKDKKTSSRRKVTGISTAILAILLIAGFFVYQNFPSISLITASSRIGFRATIPKFKPAGFGLENSVQYQAGKVVINFRSNSDDRNYTIEQSKTDLDSASMLNNYLVANNKEYQTQMINGRTVYVYDGSNATWVDGGIWYKLVDNANLPKEELLKIVSSL